MIDVSTTCTIAPAVESPPATMHNKLEHPMYSPELPPYTLDLRSFTAARLNPSFMWKPATEITLVDVDNQFEFKGTGTLHFIKTTKGFDIVGTLTGKALVPCRQCVGNTWVEDQFDVLESFQVQSVYDGMADDTLKQLPKKGGTLELHPQDFDEPVDVAVPFALGDLLRQVLITQLPVSSGCWVIPTEACPALSSL